MSVINTPSPLRWLGSTLLAVGFLVVLAWLTGQIMLDRTWWSQWLLWIPHPVLLPAGLLIWFGLWLRRSKWAWLGLLVAAAGPLFYAILLWSPSRATTPNNSISVLHWTAGPILGHPEPYGNFIVSQDPDIVIVEGARRAATTSAFRKWSSDAHVALRGPFLIASKLPIQTLRTVAWANDILLLVLVVELEDGSPLQFLIVDLPSDPQLSRASVMAATREFLGRLEITPDIVLGDFNLTQQSAQLPGFLPGMTPNWGQDGHGWGGTYPRSLPMYRLDHVLSNNKTQPGLVQQITTTDPGVGRHRSQLILLETNPPQGLPASSQ